MLPLLLLASCTLPPDLVTVVLDPALMISEDTVVYERTVRDTVGVDWSAVTADRNGHPVDPGAYTQIRESNGGSVSTGDPAASMSTTISMRSEVATLSLTGGDQAPIELRLLAGGVPSNLTLDAAATYPLDLEGLEPQIITAGINGLDWSNFEGVDDDVELMRFDSESLEEVAARWHFSDSADETWSVDTADRTAGPIVEDRIMMYIDPDGSHWDPAPVFALHTSALWLVRVSAGGQTFIGWLDVQ